MSGPGIKENWLVIPDNAGSTTFATVLLIITILFVAYEIISIAWQQMRYRKLKKISQDMEEEKRATEFFQGIFTKKNTEKTRGE